MKSPKKSEMLEVRLSHPDKLALQEKAADEGRTVSDVVRGLISSYLTQDAARSKPSLFMELLMAIKSKPKSLAATVLACLAAPFAFSTFAFADDISLTLSGEFIEPIIENGEDGKRVRRFSTEVHMDSNETMRVKLSGIPEDDLAVVVTTKNVENGISLKFEIIKNGDTIAMPYLAAFYDEAARVEIENKNGEMFTMNAVPVKR